MRSRNAIKWAKWYAFFAIALLLYAKIRKDIEIEIRGTVDRRVDRHELVRHREDSDQ